MTSYQHTINDGRISYRFRDKLRFQSKIANFSYRAYLTSRLGFRLNWVTPDGFKKLERWGYQAEKIFTSLHLYLFGYNTPV